MKKIILLSVFILSIVSINYAQVVGIGTNNPNSSAQLDVSSNSKGFLPPRVALTATNVDAPVTSPAEGLLVYNTATAGVEPNNVLPGFYYWNGSAWYPLVNKGTNSGDMQYWDGSKWVLIPIGSEGTVLTSCHGIPRWGGCPVVTLQPVNNPNEVFVSSNVPNNGSVGIPYLWAGAWTIGGVVYGRFSIKFDLSSIPVNAIIDSARFSLYSMPSPAPVGNQVDAQYGSANACYIQRITTPWNPATFTWNNQPVTTTDNQVVLPQSTSSFQDATNLDVTNLIKDMLVNGNYGFTIKMQNEAIYNIRQYASSYYSAESKRPKLIVYWH